MRLIWVKGFVCLAVLTAGITPDSRTVVVGQEPSPASPGDQPTFRVGTRLATIDAVVVDDKGRHVTDLTPADFEIVERGRTQAVSSTSRRGRSRRSSRSAVIVSRPVRDGEGAASVVGRTATGGALGVREARTEHFIANRLR